MIERAVMDLPQPLSPDQTDSLTAAHRKIDALQGPYNPLSQEEVRLQPPYMPGASPANRRTHLLLDRYRFGQM